MMDRVRRPPHAHLWGLDGPCMVLPGWAADWLERQTDLPLRRVALRGVDAGVDDVLVAIRELAMRWRASSDASSALGTSLAVQSEPAAISEAEGLLGVGLTAGLIGITGRAVGKAITEGRLPADRSTGRWLVRRCDAEAYRQNRTR